MGMTMTQKILAAHAGLDSVVPGQLIEAKLDVVMANDITGPMAVPVFNQMADKVFDKEKVNIKPNMYIDCDDIEAKHSAVIGKFKDEEIFYLMTRGIPKEEAIELLTESFLFSNLTFDKEEITNLINKYWR